MMGATRISNMHVSVYRTRFYRLSLNLYVHVYPNRKNSKTVDNIRIIVYPLLYCKLFILFIALLSVEDERFPYGTKTTYLSSQRLAVLEELGMMGVDLPDTDLLERAQSIIGLYSTNKNAALHRASSLLQYMDSRLSASPDIYSK